MLDDRGSIPARSTGFFLHHRIQTGSEARPASYPMDTGGSTPREQSDRGVKLTTQLHLHGVALS
jgi:hypothetical protein